MNNYTKLLDILNKSSNLTKKANDYYTDINDEILYKILVDICSECNSCTQVKYGINGLNDLFKKSGIQINIPISMLYEVKLDISWFMTKSEMLDIVNYLEDINHKLLIMASWEMMNIPSFNKQNIKTITKLDYSEEFINLIKDIDDDREVLVPIVSGKILREFSLIDKIINKKFSKRISHFNIINSRLAHDIYLDKLRIKKFIVKDVKRHTKTNNGFDLYHIYRGLYEGEFPIELKDILNKGSYPYIDLKIDDKYEMEEFKSRELENSYKIETEIETENIFIEGKSKLVIHEIKERNLKLIQSAKVLFKKKYGKIYCEVCGFDFNLTYGELGDDYIEGHHKIPISCYNEEMEMKVDDIALVCSNCHRMLHRKKDVLSVDELKMIVDEVKSNK